MATIPPNIIGLIFAKCIEVDIDEREVSLIGLFQGRRYPSFPTHPLEMIVFAMVNGGRGEGILQLAVYSLSVQDEYDPTADWVYRQRKWIKFPDDPNFPITLELRIKKLVFLEPL
jgi:hypothetical protein